MDLDIFFCLRSNLGNGNIISAHGPGPKTGMDFRGVVWKRVWKIAVFGLKWGQDLENRVAHPHYEFPGIPPPPLSLPLFECSFYPFERVCCQHLCTRIQWLWFEPKMCKPTHVMFSVTIVSRGGWLGKAANIKVENNRAVGYVENSLTMHNPLFLFKNCDCSNKLMECFYWSVSSKW